MMMMATNDDDDGNRDQPIREMSNHVANVIPRCVAMEANHTF